MSTTVQPLAQNPEASSETSRRIFAMVDPGRELAILG